MLKPNFDPKMRYRVVVYLRMSSDMQNKRSPEQQEREIRTRLRGLGYQWVIVKIYRDEGISGRLLRKRKGYQEMMRDIKTGQMAVDLILVDTIERFGRVEQLDTIRRDLYFRHGVLVLAADANFCDPLSPQGKALALVETMRATEDGRVKAHNVLRGKKDAAIQGQWPGGVPPLGFQLQNIIATVNGRQEVQYSIPVPNPTTAPAMQLMFALAKETGYGTNKLARLLNNHPEVPESIKPLCASTVGDQLDNTLYYGELIFNKHSTGLVDDVHVVQPNPEEEWIRVPEFCEGLVSYELWYEVQTLREARRNRKAVVKRGEGDKQIAPIAPGMTINYLLSGLLYCSECRSRMTLSSGGEYKRKSGGTKRYAYYLCSRSLGGPCINRIRIPEDWIRDTVVELLRSRLFPPT